MHPEPLKSSVKPKRSIYRVVSEISSDSDLLSHVNHAQSHDNIQSDLLSEIDSQPIDKKAKKKQLKKALQDSQAKTDTTSKDGLNHQCSRYNRRTKSAWNQVQSG